jgi:chemotaxis protein methyltransferase WspC
MNVARFESFLKDAIGLDTSSIGSAAIARAVKERLRECALASEDDYWLLINSSSDERQQLIESVVVPETWFFRDRGAFSALAAHAKRSQLSGLRLLSAPCSTGEEPYSMAMALFDTGMLPGSFTIDAIDISGRALEHARNGAYRKNSFRGTDLEFRQRYFQGDAIHPSVKECVRFDRANLLDAAVVLGTQRYDVIFCRNLLIYFDRGTQDRAVRILRLLLAKDGLLFVGPSETGLLLSHGFESANWPMAFAFRAPAAKRLGAVAPAAAPSARTSGVTRSSAAPPRAISFAVPPVLSAPDVPLRLLKEAEDLADEGQVAAARERCESFLRANGPTGQALYLMGLLHDAQGETAKAIEHYRGAIYLEPTHYEALTHLAILLEQLGDRRTATRLFERAKRSANADTAAGTRS